MTALKRKRIEEDVTQEALAKQTGIAIRTYKYYESGERLPDAITVQRLASALGTTVGELFPVGEG